MDVETLKKRAQRYLRDADEYREQARVASTNVERHMGAAAAIEELWKELEQEDEGSYTPEV